MEFNSGF